jgi:hypothetical protein
MPEKAAYLVGTPFAGGVIVTDGSMSAEPAKAAAELKTG